MLYIEAPTPYLPTDADGPVIFLAGGISGCPHWQPTAYALMSDQAVVVLNPRREHYNPAQRDAHAQQVAWEYRHLRLAHVTLFWFPVCDPQVTVQPITLLELGTALAEARLIGRKIAVGSDLAYPRRLDLELQISHALPNLPLHDTLADTVADSLRCIATPSESG